MGEQEETTGIPDLLKEHRRHIHPDTAQLWLDRGRALGALFKPTSIQRRAARPATDLSDRSSPGGPKLA